MTDSNPDIDAVLWDFGGVFTTSPFEAFARYERENGLPEGFIRGVNARNSDTNAWALFERSEITLAEFDRLFAVETRAAGHEVPGHVVIGLLHGDLRPRMVDALRLSRAHFKNGCITNNVTPPDGGDFWSQDGRAKEIKAVMAMFDHVIESSKAGVRKPDPRIYEMMCRELQVDPAKCVYLDDLGVNLKPARAMGMQTIKVVEPGDALAELGKITGLNFV